VTGRHSQRALLAVFVALLISVPAGAQSGSPAAASRVLVMPFSVQADPSVPGGVAASRWLGEAAASLLADELSALGLSALPRDGRVAVFDQLRVPMSSELTRATMIRIGELIGASEIVFGDVRMGSGLVVRARTIQLTGGRHLPEVLETGELSGIYDLFRRIGAQVARNTGRALGSAAARPAPLPLLTLESYIKGLMAATPAAQQRFLESAMSQAPRDGRILTALWSVYTDQDLHEKALAVASAVPVDSPQYRRARFGVALSLIELKRLDGAFKELTSLHTDRRSGAVSNALGIVQLRRGAAATPTAAYYFERAANEDPGQTDYLFNLGYAKALAGDTAGALTWLREVVRHQSGDGDAHLVMAAVLGSAGRNAEALRELELARLLGTTLEAVPAAPPKVPPALERVLTSPDDPPIGAQAFAAPAQRDQLETARFHLERARTLSAGGQDREAVTELRRSIYLAPYEDEPHLLLGRLYQRSGRVGDAIDEFKVAIWCRDTAAARIALGHALFSTGDRAAARAEFERALALAPDSAEAREALKKIGG
jgi:tetratricopeptide (TPR) repeat protein